MGLNFFTPRAASPTQEPRCRLPKAGLPTRAWMPDAIDLLAFSLLNSHLTLPYLRRESNARGVYQGS